MLDERGALAILGRPRWPTPASTSDRAPARSAVLCGLPVVTVAAVLDVEPVIDDLGDRSLQVRVDSNIEVQGDAAAGRD